MRSMALTITLLGLTGAAKAHVADLPLLQHALEHGWAAVAVLPLLVLLLPMFRARR